jgi:hypothetical protein
MFEKRKKLEEEVQRLMSKELDFAELQKTYAAQIAELEKQLSKRVVEYVVVHPPAESDMVEYSRLIAELAVNPLFLAFFEQLKREIVSEFSGNGKLSPDYYRGQLHLIGRIFEESRTAKENMKILLNADNEGEDDNV